MWRILLNNRGTLARFQLRIQQYPGWIIRASLLSALVVIAVPVLVIMLAAALVGGAVFAVLMASWRVKMWWRGWRGKAAPAGGDGPVKVKVVRL